MDLRSLISPNEVIPTLRCEADVLFLPQPFKGWARTKNRTNFPSKLTDYTATGLPILMWGPEDASAIRWAAENPGVAQTVTSPRQAALESAVENLVEDPKRRHELGAAALRVGKRYFSAEVAWNIFRTALTSKS